MVWSLLLLLKVHAQAPEGYSKGTVLLADGSSLNGFISDNMKKKAAVVFVNEKGTDKKTYHASDINGVTIDSVEYITIKGDFFRSVCTGKMSFLQKASSSAGKMIYNGAEAVALPGTEGKTGDYFLYSNNKLTLVNKKTINDLVKVEFAGNSAAIEKAKDINGNIPALAEAVVIYNDQQK